MPEPILVYISGPYTQGDVAVNVRAALLAADQLRAQGLLPYVPHLSHFWHLSRPHEYEYWLLMDLEWVARCDAILRLSGDSPGADREVALARELGKPVVRWEDAAPLADGWRDIFAKAVARPTATPNRPDIFVCQACGCPLDKEVTVRFLPEYGGTCHDTFHKCIVALQHESADLRAKRAADYGQISKIQKLSDKFTAEKDQIIADMESENETLNRESIAQRARNERMYRALLPFSETGNWIRCRLQRGAALLLWDPAKDPMTADRPPWEIAQEAIK